MTIAIERYDRYLPFYDQTVKPPAGYSLRVLQVGASTVLHDGNERNRRMLIDEEFDVCEFGLSAYLMARERGLAISAIPVFPRRLFSQSAIFVHSDSGYAHPADLAGKHIAINSFQTSLSVQALGDLKFHYRVPWEGIVWCPTSEQILDFPSERRPLIDPRCYGKRQQLGQMLETGEIDAFLLPRPPRQVAAGNVSVRRLYHDAPAAERRYYRDRGFFPIMHLIAIRDELVREKPETARMVMDMFVQADSIAYDYYSDPNWSRLAWGRHRFEEQERAFGQDPWRVGVAANRANLETFARYSVDQGLTLDTPDIETLFAESVRDT